jgi:hypothetical protein
MFHKRAGMVFYYWKSTMTTARDLLPRRDVVVAALLLSALPVCAQQIALDALVTPSTVISKEGRTTTFDLRGFIEFSSLSEVFPYIETQTNRWPALSATERQALGSDLLRRAVESRVVSMTDERPMETLITHTADELKQAVARVHEPTPPGYADAFLAVQKKWKHSLNCWSAAPSIPGRVLSNWYPIEEGIQLYGATYDSTEHFWQAVKYHPDVTVGNLSQLLTDFGRHDWSEWLARLDSDPKLYLANAYAIEFLRHNLAADRLRWFSSELQKHQLSSEEHARTAQQRTSTPFRFTAFEEKVVWGDLADVFHLVYVLSPIDEPMRATLAKYHFDSIYLNDKKLGFISEEFRSLMLEIWKVKYLKMARFREVITSIPTEIRLSHFLNDGDSPDIPIPVYVEYLNQIRAMARRAGSAAPKSP